MTLFLLVVAVSIIIYGWSVSRRARRNRARAEAMLKSARLGRVLDRAICEQPTVQRWQLVNLATADPARLRLVYRVIGELEDAGKISAHEADVILDAVALAGGKS